MTRPAHPTLSWDQADVYDQAERLGFERPPCGCLECLDAGVHERAQRFVPLDDVVPHVHPRRGARLVVPGRWIHGWPLRRWYDARAEFYSRLAGFLHPLRAC